MQDIKAEAFPLRDPMVHDLHIRVSRIEQDNQEKNTKMAVMENDIGYIKESVSGISRGINKILWAIGLSVLGAVMTFILSGGLAVIQ